MGWLVMLLERQKMGGLIGPTFHILQESQSYLALASSAWS